MKKTDAKKLKVMDLVVFQHQGEFITGLIVAGPVEMSYSEWKQHPMAKAIPSKMIFSVMHNLIGTTDPVTSYIDHLQIYEKKERELLST